MKHIIYSKIVTTFLAAVGVLALTTCSTSPIGRDTSNPIEVSKEGWQYQNPTTTGRNLTGVQFVTETLVWAVGARGVAVKSIDGGTTWRKIDIIVNLSLNDVCFIDSEDGWIVGDSGTIIRTTDGGISWQTQTSETTRALNSVKFTDREHGCAVGDAGTILTTDNGGLTWKYTYNSYSALHSVEFADSRIGYAVGERSTVLKTTNGGQSWERLPTGVTDFWDGFFRDIVVTDSLHVSVIGWGNILVRTDDGGISWSILRPPMPSWTFGLESSPDGVLYLVGWAGAWESRDSGSSWSLATARQQNLDALAISPSGALCAVGRNGHIFVRGANSKTWSRPNRVTFYDLSDVFFVNRFEGWVVGALGEILTTSDKGRTWLTQESGTDEFLHSVHFIDRSHGWCAGSNGTVLRTTNGGLVWSKYQIIGAPNIVQLFFLDEKHGWAVGRFKGVYSTKDGGESWTLPESTPQVYLNSVYFIDEFHGTTVGGSGEIMRTTDGGRTWMLIENPDPGQSFTSVTFVDSRHGWIAGWGNTVLRTENGGASRSVASGAYGIIGDWPLISDISFTDSLHGWMVVTPGGGDWVFKKTIDGGLTWIGDNYGVGALNAIHFVDNNNGWAVGWNGNILHTSDGGTSLDGIRPR